MVLSLPALRQAIGADDYLHRAILLGLLQTDNVYLELFTFTPGRGGVFEDIGFHPWWAHPELDLSFLRPLSVATHVLDYQLWPDDLVLHHLHNLVWYALALLVVARIYGGLTASKGAAGLALLMFALEDSHSILAAWLANRNAVIALVFGGLALLAHVRWRRSGQWAFACLALVLLALGLMAAEAALGGLAYIAAYQLTMDGSEGKPWWRRLGALVPYVALVFVWRAIYDQMGFGVHGSGLYIDPGQHPMAFLGAVLERVPVLMLTQWTQAQSDAWMLLPSGLRLAMFVSGVVVCFALALLFKPVLIARRRARFWALGMLLASVPVCAAFPMDRLVLFAGIGAFGLLAEQVDHLGWSRLDERHREEVQGRVRRWATVLLLVLHALLVLALYPIRILQHHCLEDTMYRVSSVVPDEPEVRNQVFLFVNGLDTVIAGFAGARLVEGGAVPRQSEVLASMIDECEVSRVDERTLRIRPERGFLAQDGDRLMRSVDLPFEQGERIRRPAFDVVVLEVTDDGRPAVAEFHFNEPLEHPSLRWFYWKDGAVEPFPLPQVGHRITVERSMPRIYYGRENPIVVLSPSLLD